MNHVKDIKNVRAFGLFLKIDRGKIDEFEKSPPDSLMQIVQEWFTKCPHTNDADRWEELCRVLLEPAVYEPTVVNKIQTYLRRRSSVDSAISDVFSERSGSISSPTFSSPQCYIGE